MKPFVKSDPGIDPVKMIDISTQTEWKCDCHISGDNVPPIVGGKRKRNSLDGFNESRQCDSSTAGDNSPQLIGSKWKDHLFIRFKLSPSSSSSSSKST